MIKLFRKIRYDLMEKNKTRNYLKYAIGEIVLVVIGILIALWINSLNQKYQENKAERELVKSLELELKENIIEFDSHKDYLINCRLYFIKVLNFSAGDDTMVSVDSLRSFSSKMIPQYVVNINTSTLNNYKSSGKFNLIDEKLTRLFTIYETNLANYHKTTEEFIGFFGSEVNELFLNFSSLKEFEKALHPNNSIAMHPFYKKSNSEFISYIKSKEIYELIYRLNNQNTINIAWIENLEINVNNILKEIASSNQ